jgi:hypothetical protein
MAIAHNSSVTIRRPFPGATGQKPLKFSLDSRFDQFSHASAQQLRQSVRNPVSTGKCDNVILSHGGASPIVGWSFCNNNPTRCTACFQTSETPE